MNWKLRLKNRATLLALLAAAVAFAWQVMGLLGYAPPISQDAATQALGLAVNVLVALGVVVDPTTAGVGDSQRAMGYEEPWDDGRHSEGDED